MAYDLSDFTGDLHTILKTKGRAGLGEIAEKLRALLVNPDFIAQTWTEDSPPGNRVLYHDTDSDAYVLAHVMVPGKRGMPHSHGDSWAIYGNARGSTDMTEWKRINDPSEDRVVLAPAEQYTIEPGQSRAYGPHVMHSTAHPAKAWVVRVTGTDLNVLPRYHFRRGVDEIVEPSTVG
jgi:hypothetical protein